MPKGVQQWEGSTPASQPSGIGGVAVSAQRALTDLGRFGASITLDPVRRMGDRFGFVGFTFLVFVLLPTLIGAFYTLALAPKEYVAEFRVVVRSGTEPPNLASLLSGTLASTASLLAPPSDSTQNAFMVSDYVKSRNMVAGLGGKERLVKIYSRDKGGWLSALSQDAKVEKIWTFWQSKLRTEIDSGSGILAVQVRAYTPQDALSLADSMITLSEKMVNAISDRSRADALNRAIDEVNRAQAQVVDAHQALLKFRNSQQIIDPAQEATAVGTLIATLEKERMTVENDRAGMGGGVTSSSPVARLMSSREADIERQIAELKGKLTAHDGGPAISSKMATYETLQLRSQFAEGMYKLSQSAYESAREAKERQQLYLMTVVRPSLPQQALYPRRAADIFLVFGLCFILWSIGALLIAAVLDHVN